MKIDIKPGTYVVAVSGGVDSIVLLDMLAKKSGLKLVVAHFDHGIRPDSHLDREFVQQKAKKLGLAFVFDDGRLGANASEAAARDARYRFLRKVLRAVAGTAIITAHHQDDVIETAIINVLRGTGRKGLSALKNQPDILRPLLGWSKSQIKDYAGKNGLAWREDPTNQDTKLLRNYVRLQIVPRLSATQREDLLEHIEKLTVLNPRIEEILKSEMKIDKNGHLDRGWFITLPHDVASEIMAAWLRKEGIRDFDRKKIETLLAAGKTLSLGKRVDADRNTWLEVGKTTLALIPKER